METAKKLREQSAAELQTLSNELSSEIFELKCENSIHRKLEKPHLLKKTRRQRARVLTLLKEKNNEPTD